MMAQQHRLALAALLGMSLALASSHAAALATSSIKANLRDAELTVIDLTPRDGKAPGYTMPAYARSSSVISTIDLPGQAGDVRNEAISPNSSASTTYASHPGISSGGRTTNDWGWLFSATSSTGEGLTGGSSQATSQQMIGVSVAAHTRLIYTGLAEISFDEEGQSAANRTFNSASLTVGLNGVSQEFSLHTGQFNGAWGTRRQEFSLYFDNATDTDTMLWMSFDAVAATEYYTTAVPEPESWAMLGLGALVVGAAARRRRRTAGAA